MSQVPTKKIEKHIPLPANAKPVNTGAPLIAGLMQRADIEVKNPSCMAAIPYDKSKDYSAMQWAELDELRDEVLQSITTNAQQINGIMELAKHYLNLGYVFTPDTDQAATTLKDDFVGICGSYRAVNAMLQERTGTTVKEDEVQLVDQLFGKFMEIQARLNNLIVNMTIVQCEMGNFRSQEAEKAQAQQQAEVPATETTATKEA